MFKINTEEEFWEALEACRVFAHEHEDEQASLLCVVSYKKTVGFLVSGNGAEVVSSTCCALDNDPAFREIWSTVSIAFARCNTKVKAVTPQTVGEFIVKPNQTKS